MSRPLSLLKDRLEIQSGTDGVWLHFKTKEGPHAAINLSEGGIGGPITRAAIRKWCEEFASSQEAS